MKKLGPALSMVGGIIFMIIGIIGLLVYNGEISVDSDVAKSFDKQVTSINKHIDVNGNAIYYIIIALGIAELILGAWAMSDSKGVSAFILLGLFGFIFAYTMYSAINSGEWSTPTIVQTVITGVAATGLLIGFVGEE